MTDPQMALSGGYEISKFALNSNNKTNIPKHDNLEHVRLCQSKEFG